jgi:NADH-quinone oxidoreductase subunit N
VKKQFGSDSYDSFNGLAAKNPFLAFAITVSMFSLAGIPLTAGFVGKFMMFSGALASYHTYLVVFAVINAVIGIAYYFRVIMAMYFKPGESGVIKIQPMFALALIIALVFTLIVGIWPGFVPNLI